ncbi:discoidin domain-containing protein [Pectobacterium versatile]|uniref:discoidin domain-containing protein n=1 Tax=Pectobacterium versatile TaxID=2488639 RepID=UPI001CF3C7D9|nr:discoidin domain-containing protein [Pectobacterium versatile]MCA6927134.1 discoidin domain-containing protein [Pectobacterium versatile]MCH5083879.1 discoidin domain-containing protein [Pectobacterium versatile]
MKNVNIEINVCGNAEKSTCTVNPPIQAGSHTCCHSDNGGGQEPGVSGVASVFGRTGVVTAQPGDYTADQITETTTRKFASPDEKAAWNAKQAELISGTTIRTLFGQSLLGNGDISPTPAQMGVAAMDHSHTTAEITDYTQKTKQLIHSSLEAGAGVTLSYNPANEKTIISAAGGGSGGGSGYIVAERLGATAGQNHAFSISPQNTFNLAAYALKEEAGAANQTYVVDDFGASSKANYDATDDAIFDGTVNLYRGGIYPLVYGDNYFSYTVYVKGKNISIMAMPSSLVPPMVFDTNHSEYVINSSGNFKENGFEYTPYILFDNDSKTNWFSDVNSSPSVSVPKWISVELPEALACTGYQITNRVGSDFVNSPNSWVFQGSDDGVGWVDLHSVVEDKDNRDGAVRKFTLENFSAYRIFRILITEKNGSTVDKYISLSEFKLFTLSKFLLNSNNKYYTVKNSILTEIVGDIDNALIEVDGVYAADVSGEFDLGSDMKIISNGNLNVNISFTPYSQIITSKLLTSLLSYSSVNSASLISTQTGNGKVRVAVTRDLMNWHVLRNGAWVDVGALSADTAGAEALIADGMTPAELGGITAAQWTQLFSSNNGVPDSLAFAFALDITDPVTDVATIDRLVLNVNDASSWKVQLPAEVEIRWRTDSVTFRTATAGNYKLAYQVP